MFPFARTAYYKTQIAHKTASSALHKPLKSCRYAFLSDTQSFYPSGLCRSLCPGDPDKPLNPDIADGSRTRAGFRRLICASTLSKALTIRKYSLWLFPRPDANQLAENCKALHGSPFSRDFCREGGSLADARRRRQGKKRRKGPAWSGAGSIPVSYKHLLHRLIHNQYIQSVFHFHKPQYGNRTSSKGYYILFPSCSNPQIHANPPMLLQTLFR